MDNANIVTVRWWDGYMETFEATEVRFGCDLLWMRLSNGKNRHIPLRMVRWFGMSEESHQPTYKGDSNLAESGSDVDKAIATLIDERVG